MTGEDALVPIRVYLRPRDPETPTETAFRAMAEDILTNWVSDYALDWYTYQWDRVYGPWLLAQHEEAPND